MRSGHKIDLSCTSESGNPVTSLSFTKNGDTFGPEPVSHKNTHAFQVTPEDNGALLGCLSQNDNDWQSESEALRLHVLCKLSQATQKREFSSYVSLGEFLVRYLLFFHTKLKTVET